MPAEGNVLFDPDTNTPWLYSGDPNCQHRWIAMKYSGYECNDCDGWFCA